MSDHAKPIEELRNRVSEEVRKEAERIAESSRRLALLRWAYNVNHRDMMTCVNDDYEPMFPIKITGRIR